MENLFLPVLGVNKKMYSSSTFALNKVYQCEPSVLTVYKMLNRSFLFLSHLSCLFCTACCQWSGYISTSNAETAQWSEWTRWSTCSATCGIGGKILAKLKANDKILYIFVHRNFSCGVHKNCIGSRTR